MLGHRRLSVAICVSANEKQPFKVCKHAWLTCKQAFMSLQSLSNTRVRRAHTYNPPIHRADRGKMRRILRSDHKGHFNFPLCGVQRRLSQRRQHGESVYPSRTYSRANRRALARASGSHGPASQDSSANPGLLLSLPARRTQNSATTSQTGGRRPLLCLLSCAGFDSAYQTSLFRLSGCFFPLLVFGFFSSISL